MLYLLNEQAHSKVNSLKQCSDVVAGYLANLRKIVLEFHLLKIVADLANYSKFLLESRFFFSFLQQYLRLKRWFFRVHISLCSLSAQYLF